MKMAQTIRITSAPNPQGVSHTITIEVEGERLLSMTASDSEGNTYECSFQLVGAEDKKRSRGIHCCKPDPTGMMVCRPGACRDKDDDDNDEDDDDQG